MWYVYKNNTYGNTFHIKAYTQLLVADFKAQLKGKGVISFRIDDEPRVPSSSTPVKARRRLACHFDRSQNGSDEDDSRRGTKHDLTPGSKQNPSQPKSKRFLVGKPSTSISYLISFAVLCLCIRSIRYPLCFVMFNGYPVNSPTCKLAYNLSARLCRRLLFLT